MAKGVAHANAQLALVTDAAAYISLHTGDPGTTGASEVSGGSYARVVVNADGGASPDWDTPASAAASHTGAITFAEGGGDAAVTHFGLWTAITGGTFIRGGALDTGFTYASNVTPEFATGALDLTEA